MAKGEPEWWQRKAFSESETAAAIATLQHALALAGDNPFYRENCHWLLAKARLRQQQISLAISHWQAIVDLPAADLTYRSKARELVSRYQTTR